MSINIVLKILKVQKTFDCIIFKSVYSSIFRDTNRISNALWRALTGSDAGAVVEHSADERGGRQRGVRHEQADGVRDQVARVDGDAELGQHGVYEQRGGQENRADHEVSPVEYLAEFKRADRVRDAGGQPAGEHHTHVRAFHHRVHAVFVALDGQQAAVHLHAAVRQQTVIRLLFGGHARLIFRGRTTLFRVPVNQVPAAATAARRLQAVKVEVLTCGYMKKVRHTYVYYTRAGPFSSKTEIPYSATAARS